ncbi:MAG: AI-2E family transporter [Burkholderiales bacterium]
MIAPEHVIPAAVRHWGFAIVVIAVTIAFGWVLAPFYEAILWAIVLAILFAPLARWLEPRLGGRSSLAALLTLLIIVLIVFVPLVFVGSAFFRELGDALARFHAGNLDVGAYLQKMLSVLPSWVTDLQDKLGLEDLAALREKVGGALSKAAQFIGSRALLIGENAFSFILGSAIMLYLLFFLLRDGPRLKQRLRSAIPLDDDLLLLLGTRFVDVARATVKGSVVVAIVQGTLGGLIFWILGIHAALLWGVAMTILALVPAVGAGLVWAPAALYLLATGHTAQGVVLIAFGIFVIGLVDNILRPILVGKSTRMPDYLVLISTLGGVSAFGISGLVTGPLIAALFVAVWDVVAAARRAAPAA